MPNSMRAIVLERSGGPLVETRIPVRVPGPEEVLVRVRCSGVCRTDLHVMDGELARPKLPLVLGHQVVGTVEALGKRVSNLALGQRVGVPWLGSTCGECRFCTGGRENLCEAACFTGYDLDGGYAEYAVAHSRFVLPMPGSFIDAQAAPLLCAGLIGYRALAMTGDAERVGLFGFGSAAHIVAQLATHQGRRVFAFTRPADAVVQAFARGLGCAWAGGSDEDPPERLDAAIIFAPDGTLVPRALSLVERGGTVVCAGIHMSAIPGFAYELLWGERSLRSVANLTRRDGIEFLELAPRVPIRTEVRVYPLSGTAMALADLRAGKLRGAAVVVVDR
jgi:propanol-preferring alcohol dehydrogenase